MVVFAIAMTGILATTVRFLHLVLRPWIATAMVQLMIWTRPMDVTARALGTIRVLTAPRHQFHVMTRRIAMVMAALEMWFLRMVVIANAMMAGQADSARPHRPARKSRIATGMAPQLIWTGLMVATAHAKLATQETRAMFRHHVTQLLSTVVMDMEPPLTKTRQMAATAHATWIGVETPVIPTAAVNFSSHQGAMDWTERSFGCTLMVTKMAT